MYAQESQRSSIAMAPTLLCARTGLMTARTGMALIIVCGGLWFTRACFCPNFRGFIEAAKGILERGFLEAGEVRQVALLCFSLLSSISYTSSLNRNIFTVLW